MNGGYVMKNDSFFHPFSTPIDSCFDSNNDGELTGCETAFRDAALFDMYNKATEDSGSNNVYSSNKKITRFIHRATRQVIASSTMLRVTARFYGHALE